MEASASKSALICVLMISTEATAQAAALSHSGTMPEDQPAFRPQG
jgi:hypothetical protein